jgi:hypothetical protein
MDEYVWETISITSEIPAYERITFERVGMTVLKRVAYEKVDVTILKMVTFEKVDMIVFKRVEMVVYTTSMSICEYKNMFCQHTLYTKDHNTYHIPLSLCLYHSSPHL